MDEIKPRAAAATPASPGTREQRLLKRLQHNDPHHPFIAELARLCRDRAADSGP